MKYILFLMLLSSFSYASENDIDPLVAKKIQEIKNYSSIEGTWEGYYYIKSAPEALLDELKSNGTFESGLGIRIIISNKENPKVFFKFTDKSDWSESDGIIKLVPDQLGWHIYIGREGGVWLERQWLSVARTKEKEAVITVTRTVHNWYGTESDKTKEHYYVFGAGLLKKI